MTKIPIKDGLKRVWILISCLWCFIAAAMAIFFFKSVIIFFLISFPIWLSWLIYWAYIGFPFKFNKKTINNFIKNKINISDLKNSIKNESIDSNGINKYNIFLVSRANAWKRFFARYIDISIFSVILGAILSIFKPEIMQNDISFGILILFVWIFVEAFFLSSFNSTFGKWLLKININNTEEIKLSYLKALKRSLSVWFYGLGIGFPLINLFTLVSAYSDLTRRGTTSWDKDYGLQVTYQPISAVRIIFIGLLLVGILTSIIIGHF